MKTQKILALDLGSCAFRLVLLEARDGRQMVTQVKMVDIPPQSDVKVREEALKSLLSGVDLTGLSEVVSVLDDPFACMRHITIPPVPSGELANAIRWQMQPFLAIPLEEAVVEFEPLGSVAGEDGKRVRFLGVAYPQAALREHLAFLERAGIRPTQLLPKEMAVASWLEKQHPAVANGETAVLEIGGSGCEFLVIKQGRPLFTRKIPGGGTSFTRDMTNVLMTSQGQVSLTEGEAETFKRSFGIPTPAESASLDIRGVSGMQIFSLIRGGLEHLATEVERSIAFYAESSGQGKISELYLIGGGSHLKGLAQWLQDRLGIQMTVVLPLNGFPVTPGAVQGAVPSAPLSIVAALGAVFLRGKGMNFLPVEMKEGMRRQVRKAALEGLLTAVVLGAVLVWITLQASRQSIIKQIDVFRWEMQTISPQLAFIKTVMAAHDRLDSEPTWKEVLRRWSRIVPREIYLIQASIQGKSVFMRGRIRNGLREPQEVLAEFMRSLQEESMDEVRLRSSRMREDLSDAMEFEVAGILR